jgi:chemotaxis signal transduction protein
VQAWAGAAADGDAGSHAPADALAGRAAAGVSHALVRIGADVLAVPALLVAQVLAHPQVQGLFAGAGGLRGLIQWRGHHVPLLDPAAAFGVAQVASEAPLAMVLAQGEAMAAIPVDEVVAVRTLAPACVTDARAAGIDNPLIEGVALLDNGARVLVVDGAALLATHAAPGLGRRSPDALAGASGVARAAGAHVVVDTGRRWAIPMGVLEEIMPLPTDLQPLAGRGAGQPAATCAWRRQTLPVLDLREPGAQPDTRTDAGAAPGRLLVVRHNGRHAGLWVDDVVEMLPARAGESTRFRAGGSERCMLTVGQGAARTSYPVLDLDALPFLAHGAI